MSEELERKPVGKVGVGELGEEVAALGGARVVDQDVELAEFLADGFDQRLFGAFGAQIENRNGGLPPLGPDLGRRRLEGQFVPAGQQHVAALTGKRQGDAFADAAARAGDQRDLAV